MSDREEAAQLLKKLLATRPDVVHGDDTGTSEAEQHRLNARRAGAALHWRLCALASAAFDCLEASANVSAVVLARAALETTAAIHYVSMQLEGGSEDRDARTAALKRVYLGRKDKNYMRPDLSPELEAVNVVTMLNHLGKRLGVNGAQAFQAFYEETCEYSHPNYFGTISTFCDGGDDKGRFTFRSDQGQGDIAELAETVLWMALKCADVFTPDVHAG